MQIIKAEHIDFELGVKCNNLEKTFTRAKQKQTTFWNATYYSISEGSLSIYDFTTQQLQPLTVEETYPLFFENKDYFISIRFKDKKSIKSPHIYSKLKDIEQKFFYDEDLGFLSGTVNFGNDIGKSNLTLRYKKEDSHKEITFRFEVFPTKLNFKSDYLKIIQDIENEYPYLVLDFLKKTFSSFQTSNKANTDLIWWQVFGDLYHQFINASRIILNKPHNRIVRKSKFVKADKIIRWTPALEEEYFKFKEIPSKHYNTEYKTLTTDTSENKFFKHALFETLNRYKRVKHFILNRFDKTITENFKNELENIEKDLERIKADHFFRTISNYKGIRQESLVLQKGTGYSTILKSWIMLNSGLKLLEGVQKIELKNIAELYQIWCFLEIKIILQSILGKENPDDIELAEIEVDDFIFKLKRGVKSKVSYTTPNGELIDLYHDYSYGKEADKDVRSFTVNQRPDIVLQITKNDIKDNYVLTYLYDAKYRLMSDDNDEDPDLPTEDSINQMHRYRDAIYYVNKENKQPQKEVIGGYILFPGAGQVDKIKELDYYKSIEHVNIGAFPLRPNDTSNRQLLEDHLRTIIDLTTENVLNEVSPQKQTLYETHNPYVLIGYIQVENYHHCILENQTPFYYTGKSKPSKFGYKELKYFAPYIKGKGIREFYEIIDYEIIKRKDIFPKSHPLYQNNHEERLLIKLGRKISINNGKYYKLSDGHIGHIPYRYTNLQNIRKPIDEKITVWKVTSSKNKK